MKRVLALLLAAGITCSLLGCQPTQNPGTEPSTTATSAPPTAETTQPLVPEVCQHETEVIQSTAATCTQPGQIISACTLCGEELIAVLDALGHSFTDATCTQAKTCGLCGVTEGAALGHQYISGKCDRCGNLLPEEIPSDCQHEYGVSHQTAPTCTASGSITYQCGKCSHIYNEVIPSNGHNYADATCHKPKTCTLCAGTSGDPLGHSYIDGACGRCGAIDPSVPVEVTYTVTVRSDKGTPIEGVVVSVDNGGASPIATGTTNGNGVATMVLLSAESYRITLSCIPLGFASKESYTFKSTRVNINLTSLSVTTPTDHSNGNYKVGSIMGDFTLTDTDGLHYTLSELLKEKDLVILNFWFVACAPCKAEFPYLEAVHQNYADRVQLLTMSHWDSEDSIRQLRQQMGVTFPMIREDIGFQQGFDLQMYPTTVFIGSSGKILLIDVGGYSSEQELTSIIDRFL